MLRSSGWLVVTFLLASAQVAAADEEIVQLPPPPTIQVNAFVSTAYTFNFATPDSNLNALRVFDFDHNSFAIDVAELVVQRAVKDPGTAGFRFDFVAGETIPPVSAARGLFRDPASGAAGSFDLQQAFVSWVAPVGKGLRLDVGKFVTHTGLEVIEGYDGYNWNYSRSLLFGYAIPFTHTGVKVSYPLSDKLTGMLMVTNGWDNVLDNNDGKSLGAQLTIAPASGVALYLNYVGGPEQTGSSDLRHLADFVALWTPPDGKVFLGFNADFGFDVNGAGMAGDATWFGVAGYARWLAASQFALNVRAEHFQDKDGARTGVAQNLTEFTLSPEWQVGGGAMVLRSDVRFDLSSEDVFVDSDGAPTGTQFTLGLNALFFM